MDKQIIFIIIICIIAFYFIFYKTENMTNVTSEQQTIIENIFTYINNNPSAEFVDYINFLTSIKNTNLNIIDNEVFVTFKLLKKKNMFSIDDIKVAMKLN